MFNNDKTYHTSVGIGPEIGGLRSEIWARECIRFLVRSRHIAVDVSSNDGRACESCVSEAKGEFRYNANRTSSVNG